MSTQHNANILWFLPTHGDGRYLGTKDFVSANAEAVKVVLAQIGKLDAWANGNTDAVADQLAASVGIPAPVLKLALARQTFGVTTLSDKVIAGQQEIADAFHKLGLIPKAITIADAVAKIG